MAKSNLPKKLVCRSTNYRLHDATADVIFGGCVFMDLEEVNCHAHFDVENIVKNNILSIYNLSPSSVTNIVKQCELMWKCKNCGKI